MATRRTPPSGNRRSRGLLVTDSGQLRKKKEAVKLVTNANRKRRGLLRRINPKACRKKAGSSADVASTVAVTTNRSRMSNFRSCLKKKTTTTRKTANNENVTARSKFGQKCGANSAAGRKSQSVVTLVQKEKKESSKKSRSTKMVTSSSVTRMGSSSTTTTTSTVIALISTSTTSSSADSSSTASLVGVGASSRQVAIAMYQEHQENVDHHPAMASSPKTSCKNLQKTGRTKMTCDLQHMVESIERVASGQPWIDTLVTSDKTGGESSSSDSSSASSSSTSSSSSSSSSSSESSSSSKSSEQSSSKGRRRKKTNRSIHLRNRSVKRNEPSGQSPPPVGSLRRPNQRRRLACLNAMAKVHCLYESEIRHPLAQKQHATRIFSSASDSDQSADDCSSSSSSSDSSEENETAIDKAVDNKNKKIVSNKSSANARKKEASRSRKSEKKRPAAKAPATGKKQRQSMEVAPVDLAALVMPKRMASLNATAILAASSQQWPDSPKPRRGKAQPRSLSSSDADSADEVQRETKVIPSPKTQRPTGKSKRLPTLNKKKKPALTKITKNISCVESCSTSTAVSTSTNSHILRLSANIFHHQEVDGHQQTTTTTKSNTYHQSSSGSEQNGNSVTSSSKTYQRQVTTTSSDCGPRSSPMDVIQPVSRVAPAHQRPTQQAKQQPTVQTDAQDSYSPLGALYNMRPPNLQQQQQERTPSRHQDQQHHHPAGGTTSEVSSSPNSFFQTSGNNSSGGHNMTKDRDKGWSSERVAATSLPSGQFTFEFISTHN